MILLDTHVLIWLALEPAKLSKKASAAILKARAEGGLTIAAISLWEIAWLATNGRIQISGSVESFVRDCVAKVRICPITPEIATQAVLLPAIYPKDPQDRLIGGTAIVEGVPLVTADENIRASKVIATIW